MSDARERAATGDLGKGKVGGAAASAIRLHGADNVVVLLGEASVGDTLRYAGGEVRAVSSALSGHKIAIAPIPAGEQVLKYGVSIGRTTRDVAAGEHVHSHNMRSDYIHSVSGTE